MIFVDTNYFLRFFLKDNTDQHKKAKDLFLEGARGKIKLITSTIVFFEVLWVLTSYYEKPKNEVIRTLSGIIEMDFIRFDEKDILIEALRLFATTSLSFEDCYNVSYTRMKGVNELKTFDRKLEKEFKEYKR